MASSQAGSTDTVESMEVEATTLQPHQTCPEVKPEPQTSPAQSPATFSSVPFIPQTVNELGLTEERDALVNTQWGRSEDSSTFRPAIVNVHSLT